MNLIDDTPTQQPQPGSLSFIPPASPEIAVENISPSTANTEMAPALVVEAQVETEQEIGQENEPIYEAPAVQPNKKDIVTSIATQPTTTQPTPKIVDKSGELTKTHHIQHTQDKLTEIADTDEEKFIEEVESAHGHK